MATSISSRTQSASSALKSALGNRPEMPKDPGANATAAQKTKYDRAMLQYQDDLSRYNRTLGYLTNQLSEKAAMDASIQSARHRAIMDIASKIAG